MSSGTHDDEKPSLDEYLWEVSQRGFRMGFLLGRIEGAKEFLIFLGSQKFGPPDDCTRAWLDALCSGKYLRYLSTRIPDASSWQDLRWNARLPYEPETGIWDDPLPEFGRIGSTTDSAIPPR